MVDTYNLKASKDPFKKTQLDFTYFTGTNRTTVWVWDRNHDKILHHFDIDGRIGLTIAGTPGYVAK